jgi:methyl-accepting chemotaxis protein PixJ
MNNQQLPTSTPRIWQFVRSNLFLPMNIALVSNVLLLGIGATHVWNVYQGFRSTLESQLALERQGNEIKYLDEVLTMSAKMSSTSGNSYWEKRYNEFIPKLDEALKYTFDNSSKKMQAKAQQNAEVNTLLLKIESDAFKLVRQKKIEAAQSLLFSPEYEQQKKIYTDVNDLILVDAKKSIQRELNDYQQQLLISIGLALGMLPILLGSWLLVISAIRNYQRDQTLALEHQQASQDDVLISPSPLEKEVQYLQQQHQHQIFQQDHEQLQQDIGELLGVVSEIEYGNWTVQAPVNDRSTGLIGDSINRLIKELSETLRQIVIISQQLNGNVQDQKAIAMMVTDNINQQTQSLSHVSRLAKAADEFAQSAVQQSADANQSLAILRSVVSDGQNTITTLRQDIDMLAVGSDQIVQEIKTLGEFIGLTDKFVQDQGEIVTQTTILAINAALVAARAAEQRDPTQFMIVAREFELIATQVSQLAQQTNTGLSNLEQRSSQIHRVVSAVNIDVQQLGTVINSFTQGVKHTQNVFSQVQSVTEQVYQSGENIAITSQGILDSTHATVTDIESMAGIASQALQQSQDTQKLGDQVSILIQDLLNNLQEFRFPESTLAIDNAADSGFYSAELVP